MEENPVRMMDQPYLHRQMKWRYPYATALDQRSIPYATQNFEPGLFSVYQQADGTVSAYLESAELGSISKRGTPPAGKKSPVLRHRGFFQTDVISQQD